MPYLYLKYVSLDHHKPGFAIYRGIDDSSVFHMNLAGLKARKRKINDTMIYTLYY